MKNLLGYDAGRSEEYYNTMISAILQVHVQQVPITRAYAKARMNLMGLLESKEFAEKRRELTKSFKEIFNNLDPSYIMSNPDKAMNFLKTRRDAGDKAADLALTEYQGLLNKFSEQNNLHYVKASLMYARRVYLELMIHNHLN